MGRRQDCAGHVHGSLLDTQHEPERSNNEDQSDRSSANDYHTSRRLVFVADVIRLDRVIRLYHVDAR